MTIDRILRQKEVMHLTGLSRSTIYRRIKSGEFPSQIKLTARLVGWRQSDLQRWLDTREDA
ncbi:helix-turn-helix transcriptional regulator [Neptunicoccus sediminis]|uniref:helix-turn-helix transcriptional regulator n=1 Tax=Neptunicoccus sediminis TaxID=1892596 RepID=UPI000845ED8A|nr:AlpA family transcriptional regulator [Neptunicoccus sediminis]